MQYPYQNPALPVEKRVEDLLSRMTLEEKFVQMRLIQLPKAIAETNTLDEQWLEENRHRAGSFYHTWPMDHDTVNKVQKFYLERSRLGIPMSIHSESLHGHMNENATVFPQAINLGATFDRALMTEVADQIGRETAANGVKITYGPDLDLSREPRWGRVEETYGEDPYLTGEMGCAFIKAVQSHGVACCAKHFTAHGSPERGLNLGPVHAGEREFRENMLPPFAKAIREGGAKVVMPAYSELDGEAVHGSKRLLRDVLRGELGFDGQIISDFGGVRMLHVFHKAAPDFRTAGEMALRAGVDIEAPTPVCYNPDLVQDVAEGRVPMELVDNAVRRILKLKFEQGLFENPYFDEHAADDNRSEAALALSRKAARESVILLKNEGSVLPLSNAIGKVAIVGPNADNPQLGGYTPQSAVGRATSLRKAVEARLGADRVVFAQGCTIAGGNDEMETAAVAAAASADAVVVVLGDNGNYYGGIGWGDSELDGTVAVTCGEGFDTHTLELPGRQQRLLEAVTATGKPVVLILETGRPYAISWAAENVPAILQAWYPGEQGGFALAELLFGDESPSGRLPVSMPKSVGHLPCYYNSKHTANGYYKKHGSPTAPGRDYVFAAPGALYSFGHGLSYTTFAYSDLSVPETAKIGEDVTVSVTVENTGAMASKEVVQLYLSDLYCRLTPYVCRLRGFEKIHLAPGEKKTVSFTLGFEDFSFLNEQLQPEVEPGEFKIRVGDQEAIITLQ